MLAIFGGMPDVKSPDKDVDAQASGFFSEIWRSIFPRPIRPRTERERRRKVLEFFVLHMRPVRVRRSTLPFTHTFGLGGSSLTLIGLMVFTGVLLMLAYEPTPERAYGSVVGLQEQFLFGGLVRNIHHWSANLLVAVVLLHMLRVLLTTACGASTGSSASVCWRQSWPQTSLAISCRGTSSPFGR
jgi:hypothetical protein